MKQSLMAVFLTSTTLMGTSFLFGSPAAHATTPDQVGGSAYGIQVQLAGNTLIPKTPTVTLPVSGEPPQSATTVAVPLTGVVTANALNAQTASVNPGTALESVTSEAGAVGTASLPGVELLGSIDAQAVNASCTSNASGSTATTTIVGLTAAGSPITIPEVGGVIEPNTDIILPSALADLISLEANVQVQQNRGDGSGADGTDMTVTGLVITVLAPLDKGAVIDIGEAQCAATGSDIEPVPTITGIDPTIGPATGGTLVTITGAHFVPTSLVTFGGVPADVATEAPDQITAYSPAAVDQSTNSTVDVVVSNQYGVSLTSPADQFTYIAKPTINPNVGIGFTPTSGPTTGGQLVTITGSNFYVGDPLIAVFFGTNAATDATVVNSTTVTAETPPGSPGPVSVSLTDTGGSTTAAQLYTYVAPAVDITGLNPDYGPVAGGTSVTITGVGFTTASTVTFGGAPATITPGSVTPDGTQMVVVDPPHVAGVVDVIVTSGTNVSPSVQQDQFTYVGPPTINANGLSPTSGPTSGGTPVTITGTGFAPGVPTVVDFGTGPTDLNPATDVVVVSSTVITAVSPPHAAGPVSVAVGDFAGTAIAPQLFTYYPPPSILGISPTSGPEAGGETVYIGGANLCNATGVTFGGVNAPIQSISSDCTTITVTEPPGTGTVPVVVITPGEDVTSPIDFTYIQPGYWEAAADGGVFSFGGAQFYGSVPGVLQPGQTLNSPIVAMADTPDHGGYWLFAGDGGVFAFGDAQFYGSVPGVLQPGQVLNGPIVAAEATPDGGGYREFAADGGVFDFGDAQFYGSLPGSHIIPDQPISAAVSTPIGQGYWLVAQDGGVFTYGNAQFEGSAAGEIFGKVVSMATTPDGLGYWLFLAEGPVAHEGDAEAGLGGASNIAGTIVFGQSTSTGKGYWEFSSKGDVYTFGDAPNEGSLVNAHLNAPITAGIAFGSTTP
jgi:hypothetical protein